ncbi:MAG: hypothetical protein K6E73_08465 [Bacteroidales bacterium]|nr:hypothetical protein [Bacteroidales bacterium]
MENSKFTMMAVSLAAITILSSNATAQVTNSQSRSNAPVAPSQGDVSVEVQFNPLSNTKNNFQIDGLRLRYFTDDESALRIGLGLGINSTKDVASANKDNFKEKNFTKTTETEWSINLGYERHHLLAPRLDVYLGCEAGIGKNAKKVTDSQEYSNEVITKVTKSGSFDWQVAALTGFDFYVYRGLYLGSELGLRYSMSKNGDTTIKVTDKDTETYKNPDTSNSFGFYVTPSIRLGWTF